jgi:hypothetical protein
MKYIEVKDYDAPAGKEYDASSYPEPGIYRDKLGQMRIVYQLENVTTQTMMYLGKLSVAGEKMIVEQRELVIDPIQAVQTSFSANDILKAIAISQNPSLALELTK